MDYQIRRNKLDKEENRFAPKNYCWVCCACGKIQYYDKYNIEPPLTPWWDASCVLNSVLVETSKVEVKDGRAIKII